MPTLVSNLETLKKMRFGNSVAENEHEQLAQYFIKTDAWQRLINGEVDIIYGAKGTGKSALYLLLISKTSNLLSDGTHLIAGENVSESPVFQETANDESISEQDYMYIWKLYILSLLGNYAREKLQHIPELSDPLRRLEKEGLIPAQGLSRLLRNAKEYIERVKPEMTMEDVKYSISLKEPTSKQEAAGIVSAQQLMRKMSDAISSTNENVWILFDRLDVAFTKPTTETPALRALLRVYRDISAFQGISLKIFLRDDIMSRITREQGFRELSHFTRTMTISWDRETLRHLVISRFLNNEGIAEYTGLKKAEILSNAKLQGIALELFFPKQVIAGDKQRDTFDWILSRVRDGKQDEFSPAPREVIQLLEAAREEQVRLEETGNAGGRDQYLIGADAFKKAQTVVSQKKVETIFSEYPHLREHILAFEGMKAEQTPKTIKEIFEGNDLNTTDKITKELTDIGFFQERRESNKYWIPFIFRPFLKISEGAQV